jgi:hypothetical protein
VVESGQYENIAGLSGTEKLVRMIIWIPYKSFPVSRSIGLAAFLFGPVGISNGSNLPTPEISCEPLLDWFEIGEILKNDSLA